MSKVLAVRHAGRQRLEVSISRTVSVKSSPATCSLAASLAAASNVCSKTRARSIPIKMLPIKDAHDDTRLAGAFQELYLRGEFLDVALVCGGESFKAHRAMLAAHSDIFRKGLVSSQVLHGSHQEICFTDIANPEAVKVMLDYLYQVDIATWEDRNPRLLPEVAADVIRLGTHFQLPGLVGLASRWLTVGVSTQNVLERLAKCEELGLESTRTRILQHLAKDKEALGEVSSSQHLMQNPQLLQELLQQAAEPGTKRKAPPKVILSAPKKKGRKS